MLNLNFLYSSRRFMLQEIVTTGKKETTGILKFVGLPTRLGSEKEVCAIEEGIVIHAGYNTNIYSREHRRGIIVTIAGASGVTVTYGRLAQRMVKTGDVVHIGDVIGIQGSTGEGNEECLTLEFRRNGRRVSGCDYLGIPAKAPYEFKPATLNTAPVVTAICGLTLDMKEHIDKHPEAEEIWNRIYSKIIELA